MREGVSSQNFMKIAAKEMAMMPTERPAKVLTNGFPLPYTGGSIREVPWGVKRKLAAQTKESHQELAECIGGSVREVKEESLKIPEEWAYYFLR
jgi:hypothetical protein